jgi:hypothetical protein
MLVHNNIIIVGEGSREDRKKMMLFTSTSPRYPIIAHRLALLIDEGIPPSILLEVVTILLHGLLPHFEIGINMIKNLDDEFPSLHQSIRFHKTLKKGNEKQYKSIVGDGGLLNTTKKTTWDWRSRSFIPNQSSMT